MPLSAEFGVQLYKGVLRQAACEEAADTLFALCACPPYFLVTGDAPAGGTLHLAGCCQMPVTLQQAQATPATCRSVATRLLLLRYTLAMRCRDTPGNSGSINSSCAPPRTTMRLPRREPEHTCLNKLYTLLTFGYLVVQVRTLQLTYPHPSLVPRRSLHAAQDAWTGNNAQQTHEASSASSCRLCTLHL